MAMTTHPFAHILAAKRTPIGAFQGALAKVPVTQLGSHAVRAALVAAGLSGEEVDQVYLGNVLSAGVGQAPARQAAIAAGIAQKTPTTTVSKVCGSGLMAVILGTQSIRLGDSGVVVAGGMESMSQAPYLLPKAREGYRMGNGQIVDSMVHDGLWDPYNNFHMGVAGELCAEEFALSREAQDDFAEQSYKRALAAQNDNRFADELVGVEVKSRKSVSTVAQDEEPARASFEKMRALKPVFKSEAGTITAANASKLNDGAAALVLASDEAYQRYKAPSLARIVGYSSHAQAPERFTSAPIGAVEKLLATLNWKVADVDLWEINEAFAVVPMACVRKLSIDEERVNVHGGAVALGHPIGASGARILVTLLHAMQARAVKRGIATLCIGGGEAVAVAVERD